MLLPPFTGHVTTMDNEGETALIPAEMVIYSVRATPTVNLEATLRLLAAPAQMPADVPNSAAADPVIRWASLKSSHFLQYFLHCTFPSAFLWKIPQRMIRFSS